MSTETSDRERAAATALDAHVRAIVAHHFSPETGTPRWLDFARTAGWDPRAEVRGFDDLVLRFENFDGEWIARIVSRFGYGTARGSTSRGGARALRQLVRAARLAPTAFTVDGPRGPAGVVQPGAVWLARATGQPVVPFHAEAARHWTLRSWDRTQIPKPFTRVVMAVGAPLIVAANGDLDAARHTLELRLQDTARACQQVLASRVTA